MLTPPLSERYSSPLQMVQDTSERVVYKPQSDTVSLPEGVGQSELADLMEYERWMPGSSLKFLPPKVDEPWEEWNRCMTENDDEMIKDHTQEIDKLLILSGLFSVMVSAFATEAYTWLDVHNASVGLSLKHDSVIRINIFWFTSLALSLSVTAVGVLVLQWLREYKRGLRGQSHEKVVALRQLRRAGWDTWEIPKIIDTLPILFQASLILFFLGVFDLLWSRNRIVALIVLVPIAITVAFLVITTTIPALQSILRSLRSNPSNSEPPAPFRSSSALIFQQFIWRIIRLCRYLSPLRKVVPGKALSPQGHSRNPWLEIDNNYLKSRQNPNLVSGFHHYLAEAWLSARDSMGQTLQSTYNLIHCLVDMSMPALEKIVFQSENFNLHNNLPVHYSASPSEFASHFQSNLPLCLSYRSIEAAKVSPDSFKRDALLLKYLCTSGVPATIEICRFARELHMRLLQYSPSVAQLFSARYASYDETDEDIAQQFAMQNLLYTNLMIEVLPSDPIDVNALGAPDIRLPMSLSAQHCLFDRVRAWSFADGEQNKLDSTMRAHICTQYLRNGVNMRTKKEFATQYVEFAMDLIEAGAEEPNYPPLTHATRELMHDLAMVISFGGALPPHPLFTYPANRDLAIPFEMLSEEDQSRFLKLKSQLRVSDMTSPQVNNTANFALLSRGEK